MMKCLTDDLRIHCIITKKLLSSEGKEFRIGNDISFTLCKNGKEYSCFGIIEDITDKSFRIGKVEVDGMRLLDEIDIDFGEVKDGVIHHTDNGWC